MTPARDPKQRKNMFTQRELIHVGVMERESWRRNHGGEILEEESGRKNQEGEIRVEKSWRRNHGAAMLPEQPEVVHILQPLRAPRTVLWYPCGVASDQALLEESLPLRSAVRNKDKTGTGRLCTIFHHLCS